MSYLEEDFRYPPEGGGSGSSSVNNLQRLTSLGGAKENTQRLSDPLLSSFLSPTSLPWSLSPSPRHTDPDGQRNGDQGKVPKPDKTLDPETDRVPSR